MPAPVPVGDMKRLVSLVERGPIDDYFYPADSKESVVQPRTQQNSTLHQPKRVTPTRLTAAEQAKRRVDGNRFVAALRHQQHGLALANLVRLGHLRQLVHQNQRPRLGAAGHQRVLEHERQRVR